MKTTIKYSDGELFARILGALLYFAAAFLALGLSIGYGHTTAGHAPAWNTIYLWPILQGSAGFIMYHAATIRHDGREKGARQERNGKDIWA